MAFRRREPAQGRCCGIDVCLLRQDVPAQVVCERPCGPGRTRREVRLVVDPRQLPDLVIGVLRDQRSGLDLRNIPVVIVGIGQRYHSTSPHDKIVLHQ